MNLSLKVFRKDLSLSVERKQLSIFSPKHVTITNAFWLNWASAYNIAIDNWFIGTEQERLDSLVWTPWTPWSQWSPWTPWSPWNQWTPWTDGTDWNDGVDWIDWTDGTNGTNWTDWTDGTNWIDGTNAVCPTNIVPYDNHNIIGRTKATTVPVNILWRQNWAFWYSWTIYAINFQDDTWGVSTIVTPILTNITQLFFWLESNFTQLQVNWHGLWATLSFVNLGAGNFQVVVTNPTPWLSLKLHDQNTGNVIIWFGGFDPLLYSIIGTQQVILPAWPCEQVEVTPELFNVSTDKILFTREKIVTTYIGTFYWFSVPELPQYFADVFTPSIWNVNFTYALGMGTPFIFSWTYNTLQKVMDVINVSLIWTWFSLKALGNDRIVVCDEQWNALTFWSPWLNNFAGIYLQMVNDVTDKWIIEWEASLFPLNNLEVIIPWWLYTDVLPSSPKIPTPKIRFLWGSGTEDLLFEAYFNYSDRRILDFEPEIYLNFAKKNWWSKNHFYRQRRKRIAHMANTDNAWNPNSRKLAINPRLRWTSWRINRHETEFLVSGLQSDMATSFFVKPFQFLGTPSTNTNWAGTFAIPIPIWDWNRQDNWTNFPPTLSRKSVNYQNSHPNKERTMVAYFRLEIRNPANVTGYPISSDISEAFVFNPWFQTTFPPNTHYDKRTVRMNN